MKTGVPASHRRYDIGKQSDVVVDVLQHVHEQDQVEILPLVAAAEAQDLAVDRFVVVRLIGRIDAGRLLAIGALEQKPGKDAGTSAHIDNSPRPEGFHRRRQQVEFGRIVPMRFRWSRDLAQLFDVHRRCPSCAGFSWGTIAFIASPHRSMAYASDDQL